MELVAIEIESFRSIVGQTLSLSNNTIGLVGLNESGKSNILTAIRTLDNDYKLKESDASKINGEDPKVVFKFELEEQDIKSLSATVNSFLQANSLVSLEELFKGGDFIDTGVSRIKTLDKNKAPTVTTNYNIKSINSGFLIAYTTTGKENQNITLKDGSAYNINKARIVKASEIDKDNITIGGYVAISNFTFKMLINPELIKFFNQLYPEIRYWQYDNKYLIPSEVRYEDFIADGEPREFSVPLCNIFYLAKSLKITTDDELVNLVGIWQQDSSRRRKDTEIINDAVNTYIRSIWKDYDQELCIVLEESKITVHVKDPHSPIKNYYEMIERSQGFKTFTSFILTTSADIDSDFIQSYVLVLDEPETHLHPSGVRFMRNEIFKLSRSKNKVVFATHSVFMIDRHDLSKYAIVKKSFESTKINPVRRGNITQESVIYEALGTTVDEFSIKPWNIMFEGDLDRKLFYFYIMSCIKKSRWIEDFELLDGGGTKAIYTFFKDKTLPPDSFWVLILDNDKPAHELLENMKKLPLLNFEKRILSVRYDVTVDFELEDILPINIVSEAFKAAIAAAGLDNSRIIELENTRPISAQTMEFMSRQSYSDVERKRIEEHFKESLEAKVTEKLVEISANSTKMSERSAAFAACFPKYNSFAASVVEQLHKVKKS